MGYYGLGPGANSRLKDQLTELEQRLRMLPLESALEILELLEKLCRNIIQQPNDPTCRQVKLTDAKVAPLLGIQSSQNIMLEIGWLLDNDCMVMPADVRLDFQGHVVKIIEAKDHYKKEAERQKKLKRIASDPAKAAIQQQLAIDRLEATAAANAKKNVPAAFAPGTPVVAVLSPPSAQVPASQSASAPTCTTATPLLRSEPAVRPAAAPVQQQVMSAAAPCEDANARVVERTTSQAADKHSMDDIRALQQQRYEASKSGQGGTPEQPGVDASSRGACSCLPCFR